MSDPQPLVPSSFRVAAFGLSDVGRRREHNEDNYLMRPDLNFYCVADGMGGHLGGDTASRMAVEIVGHELDKVAHASNSPFGSSAELKDSVLPDVVRSAVESACAQIFAKAKETPALGNMGTTLIGLLVHQKHVLFSHVGDSRAYIVRNDVIQQVSEDHSLVYEQIKAGFLTADEAKNSRFKNIITRSVGVEPLVQVDVMGIHGEVGDIYVLCSDGLTNHVRDDEMRTIVRSSDLADVPAKLIALANERGGEDNITVVAVGLMG